MCLRDHSVKVDRLTFTRGGECSPEILKKVFSYAFLHGVKELVVSIGYSTNYVWPVCSNHLCDSLISLKLESEVNLCWVYLQPRLGSFKSLTVLHLKRVIINYPDSPFSGFPMLEKLTLINCHVDGNILNVQALRLLEFTIVSDQSLEYKGYPTHSGPVCIHTSSDLLVSMKLDSLEYVEYLFLLLESISASFTNLKVFHLKKAFINSLDTFSEFPVLEKLTLINWRVNTTGKTLIVHSQKLLELTISTNECIYSLALTTSKLIYFEYRGSNYPRLKTYEGGLPVLDTVVIDSNGVHIHKLEKRLLFENLLSLFDALYNTKSLTLFSYVVHHLSLFPDELLNRCSPFRELKSLKLDSIYLQNLNLFEIPLDVKAYLLKYSPHAKFTMMYPKSGHFCEKSDRGKKIFFLYIYLLWLVSMSFGSTLVKK